MTNKKGLTGREKRERDKLRKREKRQEQSLPSSYAQPDEFPESAVPCGSVDGAVSAPPGNFPGQGSIGLPPFEGKLLARLQASPCEKMQPTALSNASSQGSRLCAQNGGMAPSPDSLPWVCTSPRVPELDTVHVSGSAGKAQLDMSSSLGDESSRRQNDALDFKTDTEMRTEQSLYDENENVYNLFENNNSECRIERTCTGGLEDVDTVNVCDGEPATMIKVSVQGSFHQGDLMFGENAGTQCVTNSLAALAYHKLKNSKQWQTSDMNKVLATGDELYTYLQRSSTIDCRYLLVDELPQFLECFDKMFEFKSHESLSSLINLSDMEPNYHEFNAFSLSDALQIALKVTGGCFVCFGGNTFLVGKTADSYFTFDSHSRSPLGYLSPNGRSTRILHQSVDSIYDHILSLAVSMGFSGITECEITGVDCFVRHMASTDEHNEITQQNKDSNWAFQDKANILPTSSQSVSVDDCEIVCIERNDTGFLPLSRNKKIQLCQIIGIPHSDRNDNDEQDCHMQEICVPVECEEIQSDGNCFFRAISFCLTGVQDYHYTIRTAVCKHLLHYRTIFEPFVRCAESSVENHLSLTDMSKDGIWATELEMLAVSHLLSTDVHTYTENHWVTFSRRLIDPSANVQSTGSIYLDHENQYHYNVVVTVAGKEMGSFVKTRPLYVGKEGYEERRRNGDRMREVRITSSAKKIRKDHEMRQRKLRSAKLKYKTDLEF